MVNSLSFTLYLTYFLKSKKVLKKPVIAGFFELVAGARSELATFGLWDRKFPNFFSKIHCGDIVAKINTQKSASNGFSWLNNRSSKKNSEQVLFKNGLTL